MHVATKRFLRVLTPSFSSSFICIGLGLFVAGLVFVSTSYVGSYEAIQLNNLQTSELSDNKLIAAYQIAYDKVVYNQSLGSGALFAFWCVVGGVCYMTFAAVIRGLREINGFKDEVEYVHINRHTLFREQSERLLIRLAVLVLLFLLFQFFVDQAIPWSRQLAQIGAVESGIIGKVGYSVSAVTIIAATVHVVIVLLRLLTLRVRLFGDEVPDEITG